MPGISGGFAANPPGLSTGGIPTPGKQATIDQFRQAFGPNAIVLISLGAGQDSCDNGHPGWVFCCPCEMQIHDSSEASRMKPPFDIAGDLDTPVSAFIKLKPFRPASCSRASRAASASAATPSSASATALELRLDRDGLWCGGQAYARAGRPGTSCCGALRDALARAPRPQPERAPGFPLAGGLVGYAAYDVVRYFEKLPRARRAVDRRCRTCTTSRRSRCWCSTT